MKDKIVQRPYKVAITGSVGSGKSEAIKWFRDKGYLTISADDIGHKLLDNPVIKKEISAYFGDQVISKDMVDRKKLGKLVFADPKKLDTLNKILHPQIITGIEEFIEMADQKVIIVEVPLLFETGFEEMFDLTINIAAPPATRIQRLLIRDQLSEEEIVKRFNTQLPDDTKANLADITIDNDCQLECLYKQLEVLETVFRFKEPAR